MNKENTITSVINFLSMFMPVTLAKRVIADNAEGTRYATYAIQIGAVLGVSPY